VVDDLLQRGEQTQLVGVLADHLEHRLLDPVAVGFAELGDPLQASLPGPGGGVHIIGNQQIH
jgi:hypothetical protein